MDDLEAAFSGSFQVTVEPNSTAAQHPRFSMYKMKSDVSGQDKRRTEILKLQKEKRYDVMKHVRCLTEDVWEDDEEFDEEEKQEGSENMDCGVHLRRPGRHFRNQLMLSEWMLEVPESFAGNWIMVPCPVGRRNLIIASRGVTKSYAKNGRLVNTFQSALPGGSRRHSKNKSETTILDCVYDEATQTYFVLDMMHWRNTPIYDSETEFRFYWLKTKFKEEMEAGETANRSRYSFEPLPSFPCDVDSIQNVVNQPMNIKLDGILFYHKRAHYTFGTTPLVVWLKAYMLPEILGVQVPQNLLAEMPSTYGNFQQHSETVRQQQADFEKRQAGRERKMDLQITDTDQAVADSQSVSEHDVTVMDALDCVKQQT